MLRIETCKMYCQEMTVTHFLPPSKEQNQQDFSSSSSLQPVHQLDYHLAFAQIIVRILETYQLKSRHLHLFDSHTHCPESVRKIRSQNTDHYVANQTIMVCLDNHITHQLQNCHQLVGNTHLTVIFWDFLVDILVNM